MRRTFLWIALATLLGGCGNTATPVDDASHPGKRVFIAYSCGSCHTLQAEGLAFESSIGPDLTEQGLRGRPSDWLKRKLKDPTSFPDDEVVAGFEGQQTVMPAYTNLSDAELDDLIDFLESLRGASAAP